MSQLIVGAYAAAPALLHSDERAEDIWFSSLRDSPLVGGLELPFINGLHPSGIQRALSLMKPSWRSVVTLMPCVWNRLASDAAYGIASSDNSSREKAIKDVSDARTEILKVRDVNGPGAVVAVQVQSGPGGQQDNRSLRAFTDSLYEIISWDWDGVVVSVEHCDSHRGVGVPQKGFLSLDEEVAVLAELYGSTPTVTGHTLNWARSVIESRDAGTPTRQAESLQKAASLSGVIYSGVSPVPSPYGGAWTDAHLPVANSGEGSEPTSLLTVEQMGAVERAAGSPLYKGVKIAAPRHATSLLERLEPSYATLRALASVTVNEGR